MIPGDGLEYEGEVFTGLDLGETELRGATFIDCRFVRCIMSGAHLRSCRISESYFEDCDLGSVRLTDTSLRSIRFARCRLTGIDWTGARWPRPGLGDPAVFESCNLDLSTFLELPLHEARLIECSLREVDFSGADLSGADFSGSELTGAVFRDTDLTDADLRRAHGYSIDVTVNRVSGMHVALPDALGLLGGLGIDVSDPLDGLAPEAVRRDLYDPPPMPHTAAPSVVFLCVHNAGRSQMAAAWARHLGGDAVAVFSGGSDPADEVNPAAVEAMAEAGIDIAAARPRRWTDEIVESADVVVTMGCGDTCPVFPGVRYEDWPLDDPAGMGVDAVRSIRDEIRDRVGELLERLGVEKAG